MMCKGMEICSEESKNWSKVYNMVYCQVVTQSGADTAEQDLTSVIEREPVLFCGVVIDERSKGKVA